MRFRLQVIVVALRLFVRARAESRRDFSLASRLGTSLSIRSSDFCKKSRDTCWQKNLTFSWYDQTCYYYFNQKCFCKSVQKYLKNDPISTPASIFCVRINPFLQFVEYGFIPTCLVHFRETPSTTTLEQSSHAPRLTKILKLPCRG